MTHDTQTQRQAVPRVDSGELDVALAFLGFARDSVVKKLDGLSEADVRREFVPSGTTLLGLVQHLTASEWYWFGHMFAGRPLGAPADDRYFAMSVPPERSAADVVRAYRDACRTSDAIVRAAADLDRRSVESFDGDTASLRWVLAHMTSETARHAGHADLLRELTDGVTGR